MRSLVFLLFFLISFSYLSTVSVVYLYFDVRYQMVEARMMEPEEEVWVMAFGESMKKDHVVGESDFVEKKYHSLFF